jgi:hypothetical protein
MKARTYLQDYEAVFRDGKTDYEAVDGTVLEGEGAVSSAER